MKENNQVEKIKKILNNFIKESIPEYILTRSHQILADGGIQKVSIRKEDNLWDIEGTVQSEDLQVYHTDMDIDIENDSVTYYCNCPDSFTGICPHIGAVVENILLSFVQDEEKEGKGKKQTEWRQHFRRFFSSADAG